MARFSEPQMPYRGAPARRPVARGYIRTVMSGTNPAGRGSRTRNAAVAALAVSIGAIGVAYAAAIVTGGTRPWSAWVMAIATSCAMVATTALGAARVGQRLGGLRRLLV